MIAVQIVIALIAAVLLARVVNLIALMRWYAHPQPPGAIVTSKGRRTYFLVKGEGTPTVVIEPDVGSGSPEWWGIQDGLAKTTRVLTYDRAGYGWSDSAAGPRTSRRIAAELKHLLEELEIDEPVLLVGHAQGGLYVNQFCRLYPHAVAGAVLVDPMSPDQGRLKRELSQRLFKRSRFEKRRFFTLQAWLGGFGFQRLLKRHFLKSRRFEPYRNLPADVLAVLWHYLLLPQTQRTVLDEYLRGSDERNNADMLGPDGFPSVPLRVITHSSEKMRELMAQSGGLSSGEAATVEDLWQELIRAHCSLSKRSELIVAEQSGPQIHLESPDLVIRAILDVVEQTRHLNRDRIP